MDGSVAVMDIGTSVLAKLKNKAKETGKPFQLCLQLFCQEEFLRRISMSKYKDNFVLKGGLFIYALTSFESRVTIDVDFLLRQLPNSVEEIKKVIEEIIATETGNVFVELSANGYSQISPQRKYKGISVQITGKIKQTKTPFNVDLGIGDVIIPKAELRLIPTQIDSFPSPEVITYSVESTIAEKFDAVLQRLELTSRMKDYFDIYYLANTLNFDGRVLQEAIIQTLQNRGTAYEKDSFERIVGFALDNSMQTKWKHFLNKLSMDETGFDEVLAVINKFLSPVWQSIISETEFFGQWDCVSFEWR